MHNKTIRVEDSKNEEGIDDEILFWKEYRQRRVNCKDEFAKLRTQNVISFAQQRFDAYLLNG